MRTRLRGVSQIAVLIALLSAPQALWRPSCAIAAPVGSVVASSSVKNLTFSELEHGIADRLKRVEEFRFIEQEAAKLGVRAWLFGGTAAGYAHYVKWDMQREKGDTRFQKDRFDYDYTNIYRSTQDLDIVIDGDASQAQKLQAALQQKYPHLQGSKTAWEVRLLTQDMGDKLAILNNPDFLNQHSDSNSTGMIEITKPKTGESVVRDVRDWNTKEPFFLKDVHDGMLHYYFSPTHGSTKFAKEGRNPPILSVVRYLTKAFQYELELRPEDLENIRKVIQELDPRKDLQNPYVSNWIEKNAKKLIQNAVNIEYAWETLEKLGLRKKLIEIQGNPNQIESLAWWMNKEPLRTKPIGKGSGKTAKELGVDVVAHETNGFLAYESITRAHTGEPNVLISRDSVHSESAIYGDGFYTKIGKEGAANTGYTIRFHLDPNAREGTDFILPKQSPDYVLVRNKAALKVIPESLNIGPVEYYQMLAENKTLSLSDQGILQKLKRRIDSKRLALSEAEKQKILEIVRTELEKPVLFLTPVLKEWFSDVMSLRHPELVQTIANKSWVDESLVKLITSEPEWENNHEKVIGKLKATGEASRKLWEALFKANLAQSNWRGPPELITAILARDSGHGVQEIANVVLSDPYWKDHPEWIESLINGSNPFPKQWKAMLAASALSGPHWKEHPELVERLIEKGIETARVVEWTLPQPHWKDHPELVLKMIEFLMKNGNDSEHTQGLVDQYVLTMPHWRDHPELRRLTGGLVPTFNRLKKGIIRENMGRKPAFSVRGCIYNMLKKRLSAE
jgi:hypothetical protein